MPGPLQNSKIVCYNGSSLGNLKDGGSKGGFIIFIVGENNISSPIMWKSIYSIRPMQDKRLWTEIALLREMIIKKEITKINWIENKYQTVSRNM